MVRRTLLWTAAALACAVGCLVVFAVWAVARGGVALVLFIARLHTRRPQAQAATPGR